VSQWLADRFIAAGLTANMVSVMGFLAMACAASAFVSGSGLAGAITGIFFMWLGHVLDGADGKVARASKTASAYGEIVDGICDYGGYALIYVALGLVLARQIPLWQAAAITVTAALFHIIQANIYETRRRVYCHRVYGTPWVGSLSGEDIDRAAARGGAAGGAFALLTRTFLAVSRRISRHAAAGPCPGDPGFDAYKRTMSRNVKIWAVCSQNVKTVAVGLAMLAGCPLCYFLFVLVVVNASIPLALLAERRAGTIAG
jgi:phosphatidylglycerophosphate synthase